MGKSTQAPLLAKALERAGHTVYLTREPGGTPGAEALRELLLFGNVDLSRRAEALAHMAARCDHLDKKILPALARGEIVVCDRFHDSTVAYQGYGLGEQSPEFLTFVTSLRALVGAEPDMTFWLDASPEVTGPRLRQRGGAVDRYETLNASFHARVREGFGQICAQNPERMVRIEASRSPEEIEQDLFKRVSSALNARRENSENSQSPVSYAEPSP